MKRQPFVDLTAQFADLREELLPAIEEVFATGAFIGGPRVEAFERAFAAFCGRRHAVGLSNGTEALRLALQALGVGAGDEVVTVPNTFVATVEAIEQCGARPVFVDVDDATLLMDAARVEAAVGRRTRAIVPVHLYGRMADVEALAALCRRHRLLLVEDAAQAHGARRRGVAPGAAADAASFSFYPAKNLGAAGDAGAVVTDRDDVAAAIRLLRDHGQSARYAHEVAGTNARLDALQAVVLEVKLRHLARWTERRRYLAALYRERLAAVPEVRLPAVPDDPESAVHHLFVVRVPRRDGLRRALAEAGIDTGLHYPIPVHLQPAFKHLDLGPGAFPVTEAAAREILSLPIYPEMPDAAVQRVGDAVAAFFGRRAGGRG